MRALILAAALLVPLSLTAAGAQTLPQMLQQSQQTVGQAVPGRLSGQSANGGGADNSLAPSQIDRLLGNETQINREGSATEAEGGANATGPLAEPDRFPGPTRAVFGASLFTRNSPSAIDAPTPNYRIAPGDRVSVRVWGAVEAEAVGQVDPDGNLFLPSIGPIRVAGTRSGDLQKVVESEVRRIYTQQVQVYAVLLNANRIGVFVTGFVRTPGRHTGSGAETVLDFLVRAGGVDPVRGSFRDISIQRGGRTVAKIDLYAFLLRGQLPNIIMQDNDTIIVAKQGALVGVNGSVRNNYLFEVPGRAMSGAELIDLAAPLPAATNVVVRGTRNGQPYARYVTTAQLRSISLSDQDVVSFITDAPPPTVRVNIEGSRIGPSVLIAERDVGLCQLLDYVAVDPRLADTASVYLLRPRIAAQQQRALNESLDRLERQLFMSTAATTGVAEIRNTEAQLVLGYIQRGRRIKPEGRLVVSDRNGRCADVRLEDGDTIVIPERSQTVMVAGEVLSPTTVVWRAGMTVQQYIDQAGGFADRGDIRNIMIRKASGEIILDPAVGPSPGDELIAMPRLDPKYFQIGRDLLSLIYQSAVAAYYFR
ncbi:polysaccharide biosynthesis/export family protein [Roseomonas gilardii subsp. gilardii]|uniref:polysaccharide biosynthesis/export family protein n=1 Tax=Roseomonas gilardii TaxID=257708 RepID=UPI001FF9E91A|nr:polysaccharide biosynthesis/export family protein [Roseomonas gilardii]UPG72859.1 polysaccharide biosynthesis/export family protein [Roseomonas gilardii subsp. gilardii]